MAHPPRQERSRKTVARLLDAAGELLLERGPTAITTNHIAERAEVSIGSLYQFFPNKDAIFDALRAAWVARMGAALDQALAGAERCALETVVDRVLRTHIALNEDPPGLLRRVLALPDRERHTRAVSRAAAARVEAVLELRGPTLTLAGRRAVAQTVEHIANGIYCIPQPSGAPTAEVVQQTRAALVAYLQPLVGDP